MYNSFFFSLDLYSFDYVSQLLAILGYCSQTPLISATFATCRSKTSINLGVRHLKMVVLFREVQTPKMLAWVAKCPSKTKPHFKVVKEVMPREMAVQVVTRRLHYGEPYSSLLYRSNEGEFLKLTT